MWHRKANKRPLIMGIVNVTPDSFSGDGLLTRSDFVAAATAQALRMIEDGADILDIGGESSRPGSVPISAEEELRRVIPVIEALAPKLPPSRVIAVDTIKANVAREALNAGAAIINDISALQADADMAPLIAERGASVILMDNRSLPSHIANDDKLGGRYLALDSDDILDDVCGNLERRTTDALKAGIAPDKIILDPGLGFGKTAEQNLALIRELPRLKALGYPVLIAPSRKSFIGQVLDLPVGERLEGTSALVAISAFLGADVIRVHDVKFMSRVVAMAAALLRLP